MSIRVVWASDNGWKFDIHVNGRLAAEVSTGKTFALKGMMGNGAHFTRDGSIGRTSAFLGGDGRSRVKKGGDEHGKLRRREDSFWELFFFDQLCLCG